MDILNEKIEGLVKKAEKSGMPYSILKKVYDRGMAAWKTGHRPGTTPQQWAFARVNSFVTKSSGTWGKADKDLADKVRGAKKEEIENPKNAKDIVGQVREKLGKDADAGDYVKDFRKSKAPQFKGKSDKKIQKMAIAAYLDSKEENVQEQIKTFNRNSLTASDKSKLSRHFDKLAKDSQVPPENQDAYKAVSNYVSMKTKRVDFDDIMKKASAGLKQDVEIEMSRIIGKSKTKKVIESKDENIQESGHTDVASMKTQVQIAMDALQKMQMNLGKLTDEDDLPTWWTNKVATAVNKLDGMADYIDAMHDRGKEMSEQVNLEEDICDGNIRLSEGRMKELAGYIARGMSAKEIAKKMKLDVKTIEALMKEEVELDEKEIKHDGKGPIKMSKKEYASINKFRKGDIRGKPHVMATIKKGAHNYNMLVPVVFEEVELDEQKVFVFRYEYKGKRYAAPFKSEKDAKDAMKAAMKDRNVKDTSITQDILKRGVKFVEDVDIVEFIDEAVLAGRDYNYDGKSPIKISKKMYAKVQRDSKSMIKGKPYMMALNPKTQGTELVPVVFEEVDNLMEFDGIVNVTTRNSNISKQLFHYLRYDIRNDPKIANSIPYDIDLQVDNDSDRDTFFRMFPDMEQRDIKKVVAHLKKKYGSSIKIQLEGVEQEEWMVDENSLAAQATRVISQTAIREKKDPADIDMVATDLDRKAADKNIFVQLKRAQDMKGKGDIEFLDKKKKKVDIRIINKAIDMMMKMKPADRAKMQTAIGKSYRDLLKTVQRGKV
jgi:hypothetical protein